MSDEESFVILGTSPMPSMEIDGMQSRNSSGTSSLQSDTPGSRFTSLKTSQINDLQNAQEIGIQTTQGEQQQLKQTNGSDTLVAEDEDKTSKSKFKGMEKYPDLSRPGGSDTLVAEGEDKTNKSMFKGLVKSADLSQPDRSQSYKKSLEIQPEMADPIIIKRKFEMKRSQTNKNSLEINRNIQPEMADPIIIKQTPIELNEETCELPVAQMEISSPNRILNQQEDADIKLWSRQPQIEIVNSIDPFSLGEYELKSPLAKHEPTNQELYKKQKLTNSTETQRTNSEENINNATSVNSTKITPPSSVDSNLAASFLLGEVDADVLKTSVYSQFPSISMAASAEDVVKLQNMVTEYNELKDTIRKADITMKKIHEYTINWRKKMKSTEEYYKQQLDTCRQEIEMLRKENEEMQISFKAQIEAVEVARRKDRDETVQIISEKNALLENLRTQIVKLEQQQLASFDVVYKNQSPEDREYFKKYYITRREHEAKVKELERQLSELLARNLDFKDIEKQYIDELNCLKVNLTSAEELIKENKSKIAELQRNVCEKQQDIEVLQYSLNELRETNVKQSERITLLEHQTEVHRKDFEMERESRQTALKEKQQLLQDLRNLQRHNQELIEEHQKLAQNYERRLRGGGGTGQITAATADPSSYYNNPQRPIRVSTNLPSTSSSAGTVPSAALMHYCPICNKAFKSLNILQSHVNDCIDKN